MLAGSLLTATGKRCDKAAKLLQLLSRDCFCCLASDMLHISFCKLVQAMSRRLHTHILIKVIASHFLCFCIIFSTIQTVTLESLQVEPAMCAA